MHIGAISHLAGGQSPEVSGEKTGLSGKENF